MTDNYRDNNSNGNSSLYRELRERVTQLSFPAFQILVLLWLRARGFWHISSLGRLHRRGRRSNGGADYIAWTSGTSDVPVAVQIRHWKSPVQKTVVDQMFGFLLRNKIPLGMIVTNSTVAPAAVKAPIEYLGRRIELVSVSKLVGSMAALRLGVGSSPKPCLDERFFWMLGQMSIASRLTLPKTNPGTGKTRPIGCAHLPADFALDPRQPGENQSTALLIGVLAALVLMLWILRWGGLQ